MVAFIAALGYGFGETIAKLFGWPELVCMGASFGLGLVLEEIISKICFSKAVQKKPIYLHSLDGRVHDGLCVR